MSDSEQDEIEESPAPLPRRRWIERMKPSSTVSSGLLGAAIVVALGVLGWVIAGIDEGRWRPLAASERAEVAASPAESPAPATMERPRDVFERKGIPKDDRAAQPTDEPAIFFPEAKESEHNESADNEENNSMKGDTKEFLSYIKGEAYGGRKAVRDPGAYDTMGVGVGGGGGGRYGGRFGGHPSAPFKPQDEAAAAREEFFSRSRGGREADRVEPQRIGKVITTFQAQDAEDAGKGRRKIIRSGELEFEIDSFESSVAVLTKVTVEEQGFVATVNSEKLPNGKVRGTVVLRVPPERLDTLLLKLRALGELKSQKIGSEDVTKHYTDLESRLRAARTMEERLLHIIREGKGEIKDLLQAERELGEWRTRIESMVGEINYYNNLIAHSTLTINLYEKEIRAPSAILETERVEMGIEVEDVEKAHRDAIAMIADAKGRVSKSDLKQLAAGQFNAVVVFEVERAQAGPLRDRLKQLGVLARLDVSRVQETQGGTGRAPDSKIQLNDTQILLSLYNLVNLAPRETVHVNLACADAEKSYQAILDRVARASGRVLTSHLTRQKSDQTTGTISFHVRSSDADAVLKDVRAAGEVMRLEVSEEPDTANATRSKRGFLVGVYGLGAVQPRETSTIVIATREVSSAYQALLEAAKAADSRILAAQLDESDRKNMTANLTVEVRRENEKAVIEALAKAGDLYTRTTSRAQDADTVVDSKVLLHLRLFNAANIPARETVKLGIETGDAEGAAKQLEAAFPGHVVDARHSREATGQRESALTIDVPLRELPAAIERIKALGSVREQVASRNTRVPDNDLAVARLDVRISSDILVASDSGPWANIRRGLSISVQAASWSLMLIMIGVCFVLPLFLALWGLYKLHRKLRPKAAPAPTA